MLNINLIRTNPEFVQAALSKRDGKGNFDTLLENDAKRRALQSQVDNLKAKRNLVSASIPKLKRR